MGHLDPDPYLKTGSADHQDPKKMDRIRNTAIKTMEGRVVKGKEEKKQVSRYHICINWKGEKISFSYHLYWSVNVAEK